MAESREEPDVLEHYKSLTAELETRAELLVALMDQKDAQAQKMRDQFEEMLTTLQEKENRIVDLEFELVSVQESGKDVDRSLLEKRDSPSEKHSSFYRQEIQEKDHEIERLTVELKKCSCYLQEIVNKELWEKNKEIEKLYKKQANSSEVMKLRKDLAGKEQQLKILTEKISELGLDITIPSEALFDTKELLLSSSNNSNSIRLLQDQLKSCKEERNYFRGKLEELQSKDQAEVIDELRLQNESLKSELVESETLRQKSNEICSALNTRLEELAVFLDSLLKQKCLLGFLGSSKQRKLREIINTSLDLSKSFAMSMIVNPDQSLMHLSNLTTLLNGSPFQGLDLDQLITDETTVRDDPDTNQTIYSIMPENITLTYQSHLCKGKTPGSDQVITALREQILNLKSELKLRDNELNKLNTLKELSDKTTETDVEMRQNVSKLFGTPPKCNTTSTTLKYQSEGQSESEGWSEPDRVVSRARIGLSQTLPIEQNNKDRVVESTEEDVRHSTTPTKRSHEKRQSFSDLHQQITDLQEELRSKTDQLKKSEEKLIRLTELEMKLKETEARLSESEAKQRETENTAEALRRLIEDIENSKQELQESIVTKDKETQDKMNLLEIDKSNANKLAQQFENEALRNKQMLQEFETRLKQIQAEKAKVEEEVRKEYEQFAVSKLKEAEKEFLTKLRKVEEKAEERIKNIKEEYDRDYMRKSDIECRLNEINKLQTELSDLKNVVQSYEETIEFYRNRETEFTRKGQGYQEKIVHLRRELDNTTLQYSEAVLEKSKLTNEKTSLEQQLGHNSIKVSELKQQTNDIKLELEKVGLDYQQQVSSLHIQKSKLEVKVSELESTNADLYNKLVRLQASRTEFSSSLPNFSGRIIPVVPYKRQFSDQPYTSEDNIEERAFVHSAIQNLQQVDMERQEANSSPDLGIDSDHGRFSSLETHTTIPRPLLQTLELTESMNNLLSGDSGPLESVSCESDHCCQRTLEISHENNDLKRKIQNMRRALDETLNQLNLANQQKKQVEKNICRQIHKTSQVLRKAKANLDSGSESDVFK